MKRKIKIPTKLPSEMTLKELKSLLKKRGDALPKYLFKAVEKKSDARAYRYVFWLDLMGVGNVMRLSLPRAARSVMKIHARQLFQRKSNTLNCRLTRSWMAFTAL